MKNKLLYTLLGIIIAIPIGVVAVNVSIPQATQVNQIPLGTATGNYTPTLFSTVADVWDATKTRWASSSSGFWLTTKTTDNLTQGSTNKYWSDSLFLQNFVSNIASTTANWAGLVSGKTIPQHFTSGYDAILGNATFTTASTSALAITDLTGIPYSNGLTKPLSVATSADIISTLGYTPMNRATTTLDGMTRINTTLGTPAGAFLAVNPFGTIIATTSPSGGSGTITGTGSPNTFAMWSSTTGLTASSSPMANYYIATSTVTASMLPWLNIGTTTPTFSSLGNAPLFLSGNRNTYQQGQNQNLSSGGDASADWVVTNNLGTDSKYYADFGINSSGYNNASYTITGANDAYLYNQDAGLAIGTASSTNTNAVIKFHTGGTLSSNERMRIDTSGNVGIGTTTPRYMLGVRGNIGGNNIYGTTFTATSTTASSSLNVLDTQKLHVSTQFNLFETVWNSLAEMSTSIWSQITSANIVAKFINCSGIQYLGADGTCHTDQTSAGGIPFRDSTFYVSSSTATGDYTDIQTAINMASSTNGGKIHIRAGTYTITSPLTFGANNIILEGEGMDVTKIQANADTVASTTMTYNRIRNDSYNLRHTIKDLTFENTGSVVGTCLDMSFTSEWNVENVYCLGYKTGIYMDKAVYNTFLNFQAYVPQPASGMGYGIYHNGSADGSSHYSNSIVYHGVTKIIVETASTRVTGVYGNSQGVKFDDLDVESGAQYCLDIGANAVGWDVWIWCEGNINAVRLASGSTKIRLTGGEISGQTTTNITDNGSVGFWNDAVVEKTVGGYDWDGTRYFMNANFGFGTTSPESKVDIWGVNAGKILTLFSNTGIKIMEVLNTGVVTLLGIWNFGDATALEIPNGTAPVSSQIGQISFDTTDKQLLIATSTNNDPAVIPTRIKLFGGGMASSSPDFVSGGIVPLTQQLNGFTIDQISCQVDGGTSVVINVSNIAGTTDSTPITCDTDGQNVSVTANKIYPAGSYNRLEIGTVTGAVDYLTYSVWGYLTRE